MQSLTFALVAYLFTIVFAMMIAGFIPLLARLIKKMNLDRNEERIDLAIPSSDSMKEEETVAVAIAVAHLRGK